MELDEHGGIRTPDPQDRNLMLYPLSYVSRTDLGLSFSLGERIHTSYQRNISCTDSEANWAPFSNNQAS